MNDLGSVVTRLNDIATMNPRAELDAHDARGFIAIVNEVLPELRGGAVLKAGDEFSEKGNTHLWTEEGDHHAVIIKLGENLWMTLHLNPDNSPACRFNVVAKSEADMAKWVMSEYDGWIVGRCNIDGVNQNSNRVGSGPLSEAFYEFLNVLVDSTEAETLTLKAVKAKVKGMTDEQWDAEFATPTWTRAQMLEEVEAAIDQNGEGESVGQLLADHEAD